MRKIYTIIFIAIILITLEQKSQAIEESGIYLQANISAADLTDTELNYNNSAKVNYDSEIGLGSNAELGYKFNKFLRADFEAAYRKNDVSALGLDGKISSGAAMGNMYVDVPTGTRLTPFVGGGLGYAYITDSELDDTVFAYQAMAGLSFAASEKTDVIFDYKYFGTMTPKYDLGFGASVDAPYKVHNVELGVRYKF